MTGRLVWLGKDEFIAALGRKSGVSKHDDVPPTPPTAADIDALVTDEFVDELGPAIADEIQANYANAHPDDRSAILAQCAIKAALRVWLEVKG